MKTDIAARRERAPAPGRRPAHGEAGQATVLVAIAITILCGMSAFALDGGLAMLRQRDAQSAADAAALAGAADLPGDPAAAAAASSAYAARNGFVDGQNGASVTIVTPPTDSQAHNGDPAAIEVTISQRMPTSLMRVLGIAQLTVAARAIGVTAAGAPCGLCVLNPSAPGALTGSGNGTIDVAGAGVAVDSSAADAATVSGNATIEATGISTVGGYSTTGNARFDPTPTTGILPVPDPLAGVPPPSVGGGNLGSISVSANNARTIAPGVYTNLSVSGNGTLTLQPGVYVITGQVTISGNGALLAEGVTLYFTCSAYSAANTAPCNGTSGGSLALSGNGTYTLTAPSTGPYQGLGVFYDRGNTAPLTLSGNGSDVVQGTIYARSAAATITGNGASTEFDALVVASTATLSGNGTLTINYSPDQNYPVQQIPRLSA